TLVEGNISVKALIDTTSKFNTISKSLFDKLKEDYELKCLSSDELIDVTEVIDFQIHKNSSFNLVLEQDWLWAYEVKINFKFSPGTYEQYGIITDPKNHCFVIIDDISIPLIEENSNKTSTSKNNLSKLMKFNYHGIFHNIPPAPSTPRRLNNDVLKNSRASKNKKYSKVDLGDGCGKLSIKMYLNNIWKSTDSSNSCLHQNKSKKGEGKYFTNSDTDTSDTSTSYSSNLGPEGSDLD
ncbi:8804_t:CDS:2, partial [Diversispora eburnea]